MRASSVHCRVAALRSCRNNMMRRGDDPKLAPEQEQALLEKLRLQREQKSYGLLQLEAQSLSAKMATMDLTTLSSVAKESSAANSAMACAPLDGRVALVLNVLLRTCSPPAAKDSPAKGKGAGGGKKQQNSIKAAAAKVLEGEPPESAQVRKVVKANKALLAEATNNTAAGQLALLKALQAWLVSPQGVNAVVNAAKILMVLYETDLAEDEVFTKFWADLQAQLAREETEYAEAKSAFSTLTAEKAAAEEAAAEATRGEKDAIWSEKQAEALAQATRCGGNPSKEEESAEKAAIANLKKCKEYRTQTGKVFAARAKDLTTVNAEFETSQRLVEQLRLRGEGGGALFTKHAAPFFEWLAASSEEEEEEAEKKEVKAEKKEVKEVKEVKEAKEVKEVKEVDVD